MNHIIEALVLSRGCPRSILPEVVRDLEGELDGKNGTEILHAVDRAIEHYVGTMEG
jgi:hypothetical protein